MDDYSLFFVIAISILVISTVFLNILFLIKLKKLTAAISHHITENSDKIVNQLHSEFSLLTSFDEFIRNNLKLYSDTVIFNLSELHKNSNLSLDAHKTALSEITSILKNELNDLRNITTNSISNSHKVVIAAIEKFEKTQTSNQDKINNILKNGLDNIDKSLRETIDVD